jgi:hypothetical protein
LTKQRQRFANSLGNTSILGQAILVPVFELGDEPGFWIVTALLGVAAAYNVYEVVVLQRGPNWLAGSVADEAAAPKPPPLPLGRRQGVQQPVRAINSQASVSPPTVPFTPPPLQVPAGWYRDPHGQPCNRWRDGSRWTHNTLPPEQG